MRLTEEQYAALQAKSGRAIHVKHRPRPNTALISQAAAAVAKKSKFKNIRCVIDGERFDSLVEGERYEFLKLLQSSKEISALQVHPRYPLHAVAHPSHPGRGQWIVGEYEADFEYRDRKGSTVIEDVKGVRTPMYRWKRKHFEIQYGQKIREITKKDARQP